MGLITIGKTALRVEQNGFGALPIQRIPMKDAVCLLKKAYDGGMTFFDTARAYTDSEEKLAAAFAGMRHDVIIATKTMAKTTEAFWHELNTSLKR